MFHNQHVYDRWHVFIIFSFFCLPRASYFYIQCGFIPSMVWRFCNIFSSSFKCRKLALSKETSYIPFRCSWQAYWGLSGIWVYLAVCLCIGGICVSSIYPPYICAYVTSYVHMSPIHPGNIWGPPVYLSVRHFCVCQYTHLSLSSSIACQQLYNCGPVIPVDQCHC